MKKASKRYTRRLESNEDLAIARAVARRDGLAKILGLLSRATDNVVKSDEKAVEYTAFSKGLF
ncbi:hypothetical protein VPHD249_0083 [Vibrio phage D249]|nr:hypothetical protein SIPHO036v1_110007 [Vibrio phage 70E38.1]QZI87989.1 hypothetical protein SIPHO041v1_p0078 [Vibrio phage 234P1]QZI88159.1 hypothetical protein SIPHO035v1_p0068 [Vibrio phage 234P7B]QZI88371.1 hypothetical protein SIPHO082v1_p0094 [Vibrio phage 294E48.1]QZI88529.1 hypothetical protein SIPHO037v1_p0088 [Vibrio phage 70E35.2]QZI88713.1 hypothetical protein SIPHO039v1_p0084 [Vibrio phage 70E35.5a]QZI88897.1 hypothetical protein SIPHO040v1_p0084 [Vibrio phage 70E35.6]QZI8912